MVRRTAEDCQVATPIFVRGGMEGREAGSPKRGAIDVSLGPRGSDRVRSNADVGDGDRSTAEAPGKEDVARLPSGEGYGGIGNYGGAGIEADAALPRLCQLSCTGNGVAWRGQRRRLAARAVDAARQVDGKDACRAAIGGMDEAQGIGPQRRPEAGAVKRIDDQIGGQVFGASTSLN